MKKYSLIVIGAGAAGLVIALGAVKANKKVLLIEKGPYGGDCTNFGCIPSKSLIASAHAKDPEALERVRRIVAEVRSHEDAPALEKQGVQTCTGVAQFKTPNTISVNGEEFSAKQIVIATGSFPFIPPIPGLEGTPYLTNETVFDLTKIPSTLAVIGGGPIGCELAQAFQKLGSQVTLIHKHDRILNREPEQAQEVITQQFEADGMQLNLSSEVQQLQYANNHFHLSLSNGNQIQTEALLIAIGRRPNLNSLHLEAANVDYTDKGITVDAYGRTSQPHIWAVGDVTGAPFFTHWAESQARSVLTSLLLPFPFKKKIDKAQPIPRVTFTHPEVASIGQIEETDKTATYHVPLTEVDRAITEGLTQGFIRVVTKKWSSKILGCTIVAPRAGEMLGEISVAMLGNIPLRKLAHLIHPYPTYNQGIRKAADKWLTQTILPKLHTSI